MRARIITTSLVLSLVGNGVLAYFVITAYTQKIPQVRKRAWRSCPKLAMQHILYTQARERARREGLKLVVVGNPSGGWVNKVVPVYGCGDICIDLYGCRPCDGEALILSQDATQALKSLPDNSAVVFESGTFELVDDMRETVRQLDRITGKDHTRIYSVHSVGIDEWSYHTRGVRPPRPSKKDLKRRRKNRHRYAKTGEGLARRIIYRFPPRDRYAWAEL